MIKLTRLRQNTPFILNPDHIERIDTHVDTVVKLTSGNEYVVNETGEDIVRMTVEYRALVLASAGRMAVTQHEPDEVAAPPAPPAVEQTVEPVAEPDIEIDAADVAAGDSAASTTDDAEVQL